MLKEEIKIKTLPLFLHFLMTKIKQFYYSHHQIRQINEKIFAVDIQKF